jgi:hypothetical protein
MAAAASSSASDTKCVNTIRAFCADVVQKANSGHPGELPCDAPFLCGFASISATFVWIFQGAASPLELPCTTFQPTGW